MRGILGILGIAAMMGGTTDDKSHGVNSCNVGAPPKSPKQVIPKGCQEFVINGQSIIALSYNRAIKKYNKRFKNKSL